MGRLRSRIQLVLDLKLLCGPSPRIHSNVIIIRPLSGLHEKFVGFDICRLQTIENASHIFGTTIEIDIRKFGSNADPKILEFDRL